MLLINFIAYTTFTIEILWRQPRKHTLAGRSSSVHQSAVLAIHTACCKRYDRQKVLFNICTKWGFDSSDVASAMIVAETAYVSISLFDVPVQEPPVEVIADGVVDKSPCCLRLTPFLVAEDNIIVPAPLHLQRMVPA